MPTTAEHPVRENVSRRERNDVPMQQSTCPACGNHVVVPFLDDLIKGASLWLIGLACSARLRGWPVPSGSSFLSPVRTRAASDNRFQWQLQRIQSICNQP